MRKETVTICIPAYNLPDYTQRALDSCLRQTYRPIEVILIDDASPNSLQVVADVFRQSIADDPEIAFRFARNTTNLRGDNPREMYSLVDTEWMVFLPHDDEFLDSEFIVDAMQVVGKNQEIGFVYANSRIESDGTSMLRGLPDVGWIIKQGKYYPSFVHMYGYPAWSAILFNISRLKDLGWPNEKLSPSSAVGGELGIYPEDFFSAFSVLAMVGSFAVSTKLVSQRGCPTMQLSQLSSFLIGNAAFYVYNNLREVDISGPWTRHVKSYCALMVLFYSIAPVEGRNDAIVCQLDRRWKILYSFNLITSWLNCTKVFLSFAFLLKFDTGIPFAIRSRYFFDSVSDAVMVNFNICRAIWRRQWS